MSSISPTKPDYTLTLILSLSSTFTLGRKIPPLETVFDLVDKHWNGNFSIKQVVLNELSTVERYIRLQYENFAPNEQLRQKQTKLLNDIIEAVINGWHDSQTHTATCFTYKA